MNYKKLFVGLAVVALIFGVTAVSAKAATIEELLAQIALLQQQLNQMQGGGGSAPLPPLTVGSTGEGVRSLQQWLNGHGFTVAASGPGSTGMESTYFGALTQAAVARFQVANGITPAAGYYGNITYNAVLSMGGDNSGGGGGGGSGKAQCADGIDNDSDGKIDGFDTDGCTSMDDDSELAGGSGGGSGQSDGKLTTVAVTLESSPADGTDLASDYKGVALAKWKLRTSSSPGILKQFGIQTTDRSWLYWLNARLYVGDTLVSEKTGLSSSSFSEVTVGSKYNLTFDNVNYSLPVDTDVYVTLKVDAVSDTGRSASSGLIIQQDTNQIIVLDANDSYSVSTGSGTGTSSDRTWDWVAAQTGNAVPSNNGALAAGARWIKVSQQTTTDNVTMAVFDIKAESKDLEINTLKASASTSGDTLTTDITAWDLYEGSCAVDGSVSGCTGPLAGGSVSGSVITFSNLTVQIPKDTKKTFTIKAKWADESDFTANDMAAGASTTIFAHASWITGVDKPTFNNLTVSGSNVTAASAYAVLFAPVLSGTSLTMTKSNPEYIGDLKVNFTLKADGGNLYVSSAVNTLLATSTTASTTLAQGNGGLISIQANPAIVGCDSDGSSLFCIPNGESRTFTITGAQTNKDGNTGATGATRNFKVTKLYFDDDTSGLQEFWFDTSFAGMGALSADAFLDVVDRN